MDEKTRLTSSCITLIDALVNSSEPQKIAEAIAKVTVYISDFMSTGAVSYEAVDTEICNIIEKETIECKDLFH